MRLRHLTPLLIKFVMITAILYLILGLYYAVPFGDIFFLSLTVTLIGYVTDLFILPRVGNYLSILLDLAISYGIVVSYLTYQGFDDTTVAFTTSLAIGVGEWFFHKYIKRQWFKGRKEAIDGGK